MRGFGIRTVPDTVLEGDEQRFSDSTVRTVVQCSGLPLADDIVRQFCWWFVGRPYGWKTYDGSDWAEGFGAEWALALGQHLGLKTDRRTRRLTLHMGPKAGTHNAQQFHWTRFIAIDIDARPGQPAGISAIATTDASAPSGPPLWCSARRGKGYTSTSRWRRPYRSWA